MPAEPAAGWTGWQRRLHWATAVLVLLAFPLGWVMVAVPLHDLLAKFLLFQLHKTIGITVIAVVLARLALRAVRGRPGWEALLPDWQCRAAAAMHATLYGLLLAVPLLGYLTAATAPSRVPTLFLLVIPVPHLVAANAAAFALLRLAHRWSAVALVVLASGHVLAAIHNQRRGSTSLRLMWSGRGLR